MRIVPASKFEEALRAGGLAKSAESVGIGRELSYPDGPARTVVVQFTEHDPVGFRSGVTQRILHVANTWYLFPRYGALPIFGLPAVADGSVAVEFSGHDRLSLARYLATRPMTLGTPGLDLYAVASEGQVLMTWDHHTEEDGLGIQLQRVADASTLVSALCEFGSELSVFSKAWGNAEADV